MIGAVWAAPGRVNLIGEHTDYNEGFVLPLALPQRTTVRASLNDASRVRVSTVRTSGEVAFDVSTRPGDVHGWAAYVAGVVWAMGEAGHRMPGVDLHIDSDVPVGAGLSSSAALECAVAVALDELGGLGLSRTELALLAQRAENDYVGVPCGVMDQMAAMHGQTAHLVFLDCRSLAVEQVPFDPAAAGVALLVIDTRAPHRLVDGEYADRRRTCERAAQALGVRALRDGRSTTSTVPWRPRPIRPPASGYGTSSPRTPASSRPSRLLRDGKVGDVGPLLTGSHASMRDDYQITVPEVDVAVEAALEPPAPSGARMTGGGFGGCVIALIDAAAVDAIMGRVRSAFAKHGFAEPVAFVSRPGRRRTTNGVTA